MAAETSRVFDAHSHAFPDAIAGPAMKSLVAGARWVEVHPVHDGTVAGLVACMDRAGVEKTILCSVATRPGQVRKITDWSAATASDRIVPFASIHPDFDAPEAEVERVAGLGIKGLKFHPQYMNCPADDPRVLRIARAAASAGLAMTFHAGYDLAYDRDDLACPRRIRALHEAVPGLRLMACHLGGWQDWEEAIAQVAGRPIYVETSYTLGQCPPASLERFLAVHPAEYLLFGSDSPWADPAAELARFHDLPIPQSAQRLALWANPHHLLGVQPPAAA